MAQVFWDIIFLWLNGFKIVTLHYITLQIFNVA